MWAIKRLLRLHGAAQTARFNMSWTKKQLVAQAFEEIGFATYIYDAQPEQLESVLRRLNSMMGTWNAKGIRLGYPITTLPAAADLDQDSNLPDSSIEAVYLQLAIRISPSFGKAVPQELKQTAKEAYDAMLIKIAHPIEMQFPQTLPAGQGTKPWRRNNNNFLRRPIDPLLAGQDDKIDFD